MQVSIKVFRIRSAQNLRGAKQVSIQSRSEVCSRAKLSDSVGADPDVEEAIP